MPIPGVGLPELILVLLLFVLLFGATKLPMLGRGLGEGISNFKKGLKGSRDELDENAKGAEDEAPKKAS